MSSVGNVRSVVRADLPQVVELCREHAEYERSTCEVHGLKERLEASLFDPIPRATCWVLDGNQELAGFAVASEEFSTWDGRSYLHLDCLFLRPSYRGQGLGRKILRQVAAEALSRGAVNLQWQTPDWNTDAIRFYERTGARNLPKRRFTLDAEGCRRLTVRG